jgi:hypothetical protein
MHICPNVSVHLYYRRVHYGFLYRDSCAKFFEDSLDKLSLREEVVFAIHSNSTSREREMVARPVWST